MKRKPLLWKIINARGSQLLGFKSKPSALQALQYLKDPKNCQIVSYYPEDWELGDDTSLYN